jgi:two-component system, NarL family, sensor histidine kinase FusK
MHFRIAMPNTPSRLSFPPLKWLFPAMALAYALFFYGFFHWMLAAGLMFSVFMVRPRGEWPAWYVAFCLVSMLQYFTISYLSYGSLAGSFALQGPLLLFIGNWLLPAIVMLAMASVQRLGFRPEAASTLRGMSLLHAGAAMVGLLLMAKDYLYIFIEGTVGDIRGGRIVDMQPILWPESLPLLLKFGMSHFMGGFLGVMLIVPMALWLLIPANRSGSARIIRSTLIYLYLLPMLLYFGNSVLAGPNEGLAALLKILLLAAVVVFAFLHGWRGAALSVLVVSVLIAVDDHLHGNSADILELQLYVAVMGAMALLFGASVDELRQKERQLSIDKDRLQVALAALAESSRRSLHSEELERKRLARELHDEMGQTLTAIQTQLSLSAAAGEDERAEGSRRMEQLTQRLGHSLRSVVNALTPDELDQLGLYTAITHGSPAQMCERAGIAYATEIYGDSRLLERLDMLTNLAAYRIVQEAVNNAIKHSHAQHVTVRLRIGERQRRILVLLDIRDDGIGLKSLRQIELGFYSLRDRTAALDGVLNIQNLPGVRVHVLLRQ